MDNGVLSFFGRCSSMASTTQLAQIVPNMNHSNGIKRSIDGVKENIIFLLV